MATAATKNHPTKNGNIVVRANFCAALRAGGWRQNNGLPLRNPHDTHVQKASDQQSEHKNRDVNEGWRDHFSNVPYSDTAPQGANGRKCLSANLSRPYLAGKSELGEANLRAIYVF